MTDEPATVSLGEEERTEKSTTKPLEATETNKDGIASGEATLCQECGEQQAKYCCPRCNRRTCSLACVTAHKDTSGCSGKRDRTAFLGRGQLNEQSLLSDYRFLEEVKLVGDGAKRAKPPAPRAELPAFLQSLVYQARRRGVQLHILPPGMEKRKSNTTRYDNRAGMLSWRIEWIFPAANNAKTSDVRVSEKSVIGDVLRAHLSPPPGSALKTPELARYATVPPAELVVVMRKERTPANSPLYHLIDFQSTLGQALAGKVVVEFPMFEVLLLEDVESGKYPLVEQQTMQQQQQQEGAGDDVATAAENDEVEQQEVPQSGENEATAS